MSGALGIPECTRAPVLLSALTNVPSAAALGSFHTLDPFTSVTTMSFHR